MGIPLNMLRNLPLYAAERDDVAAVRSRVARVQVMREALERIIHETAHPDTEDTDDVC